MSGAKAPDHAEKESAELRRSTFFGTDGVLRCTVETSVEDLVLLAVPPLLHAAPIAVAFALFAFADVFGQ